MQNIANVDNERDKKVFYVCGLFIAKTIQPHDIVNYVNCFMPIIPYLDTYSKIEELHRGNEDEDIQVDTTKIKISLQCSFTCMRL